MCIVQFINLLNQPKVRFSVFSYIPFPPFIMNVYELRFYMCTYEAVVSVVLTVWVVTIIACLFICIYYINIFQFFFVPSKIKKFIHSTETMKCSFLNLLRYVYKHYIHSFSQFILNSHRIRPFSLLVDNEIHETLIKNGSSELA